MKTISVLLIAGLLATSVTAIADPLPGCVKWSQLPEMYEPWGYDVESNHDPDDNCPNVVVMDDWLCEDGLPITDVHWWGSYFDPAFPITAFHVSIHWDIPESGGIPSHPGDLIVAWNIPFEECNETWHGVDYYGKDVYQYFCYLPEWFWQDIGEIYWLDIKAIVPGAVGPVWGWHTAVLPHNIDDAVVIYDYDQETGHYTDWEPLEWEYESLDMAFELTTIPEPATIAIIAFGAFGLAGIIRRRKR